jgi:regulator of nonsense transcripts 1
LLQYCVEDIAKQAYDVNIAKGMSFKEAKAIQYMRREKLVKEADVICATCIGCSAGFLAKFPFQCVLIDEASQAHELSCLVPVMHGCQQLVLVGDHCQLPPVICCDVAAREGLNISLFDRLVR